MQVDLPGGPRSDSRTVSRVLAPGQDVSVAVPATSANLGPGFDSLGLALTLYDTVRVRTSEDEGIFVEVAGEGAGNVPLDSSHLVVRTLLSTLEAAGYRAQGLHLSAENAIPHGRGLGSSASAIVSGVLAANALLPADARLDAAGLLHSCSALEGHPDNVAPALAGDLAISWETDGVFRSTRAAVHPDVVPVVAVPSVELSTESARGLLPATVAHRTAAANAGRAALLIHALTVDPTLLLEGTWDGLHQDFRAPAMLPSARLLQSLRTDGFAAVISGAGPTVMCLANGDAAALEAEQAMTGHLNAAGTGANWRVLRLGVERDGARVEVHQR
ncbi:homoserine kinase [Arthrobacter sp. zg-Y877]|uniref:homoserine kinase n=1 Tax=Arthrobacter sp. zg-Y877 TaxID=3049074 RepID=UPI0025A415E7|nr:homoserine kinase [Arthrobacter sp. zg-Y877]MDM7989730.1 homoserine kinase [Arthrobacter sp. zg-Y877]